MSDIEAIRRRIENDPYCKTLGIEIVDLERGTATTRLKTSEELTNFYGMPHGGAIYSLADAAFAAASNSHGYKAVALETNVSYLAAVDTGTVLTATAQETRLTGRTGEYEVVVTDENGNRVATFRGRAYRPG